MKVASVCRQVCRQDKISCYKGHVFRKQKCPSEAALLLSISVETANQDRPGTDHGVNRQREKDEQAISEGHEVSKQKKEFIQY